MGLEERDARWDIAMPREGGGASSLREPVSNKTYTYTNDSNENKLMLQCHNSDNDLVEQSLCLKLNYRVRILKIRLHIVLVAYR